MRKTPQPQAKGQGREQVFVDGLGSVSSLESTHPRGASLDDYAVARGAGLGFEEGDHRKNR